MTESDRLIKLTWDQVQLNKIPFFISSTENNRLWLKAKAAVGEVWQIRYAVYKHVNVLKFIFIFSKK